MSSLEHLWSAYTDEADSKKSKTVNSKHTKAIRMDIVKKSHCRSNPRGPMFKRMVITHVNSTLKSKM